MATINITTGSGSARVEVTTGGRGPAGTAGPGTNVTISTTPPANPDEGDKWVDSESMVESVWYNDGTDGGVWVQTSGDTANATSSDLAPVAVADSAERKLAATYTALNITPDNGLRVIQDDLPDVVWTLLDVTDITLDANWAGAPRTNASGQLPLSGVVLETYNKTVSVHTHSTGSGDGATKWQADPVVSNYRLIPLASGFILPADIAVNGGKLSLLLNYRAKKSATGTGTPIRIGIIPTAALSSASRNFGSAGTAFPNSTILNTGVSDIWGQAHIGWILTPTTANPTTYLYAALETNHIGDYGRLWDITGGIAAFESSVPTATAQANDSLTVQQFPVGAETDLTVVLYANTNGHTLTVDFAGIIGMSASVA